MAEDKPGDVNEPEEPTAEAPAEEQPAAEAPAEPETPAEPEAPAEEEPAVEEPVAEAPAEPETPAEPEVAAEPEAPAAEQPAAEAPAQPTPAAAAEDADETPRVKPEIPGADLEVDIVREDEVRRGESRWSEDGDEEVVLEEGEEPVDDEPQPIADAAIDLAAGARYTATGKRKTAVARVILKPGTGAYEINGRTLEQHFPRNTLQRNIRQPLETVGYETRMDVVALMHGGGVSAQAGALRHGISRALLEADPNLRSELKRRGFLTRDARVKERKKAGLKKARKRPQFSKR
jgi:small subunit ribosomal protein S9